MVTGDTYEGYLHNVSNGCYQMSTNTRTYNNMKCDSNRSPAYFDSTKEMGDVAAALPAYSTGYLVGVKKIGVYISFLAKRSVHFD